MLIEIHMIQNHSPANLNRDDLGAPKTCYFGGVLRSRISSQCLKRSIRMSEEFKELLGGIRTRRLAELIAKEVKDDNKIQKRVEKILEKCGIKPPHSNKKNTVDEAADEDNSIKKDSKMLVYTTREAIRTMAELLKNNIESSDEKLPAKFAKIIAEHTFVPDMSLSGRMLEPGKEGKEIWQTLNTTVEASLQAAHAISTHEARPEIDYFVAADDIQGNDTGAGFLDESMFSSACFYKYFSINWEQLLFNLGYNKKEEVDVNKEKERIEKNDEITKLAIHTVGAFMRAAAMTNPSGKQNSFAAHNPPDGILVELKSSPVSYANAFAEPVSKINDRGVIGQSIAQLSQYALDISKGFGKPIASIWFSPNKRFKFDEQKANPATPKHVLSVDSLDDLTEKTIGAINEEKKLNISWQDARKSILQEINRLNSAVLS
jgi:CRISPR system Cascade subunit CasC